MRETGRTGILMSETLAYEPTTQLAGVQIIMDFRGMTRRHMPPFSLSLPVKVVHWILVNLYTNREPKVTR